MSTPRGPLAEPLAWNLVSHDYALEVVPQFEKYASDALRVAGLRTGARVLDVAAGPGTLALLAAKSAERVEGLQHLSEVPDMATFWSSMERTMAPIVLLRRKMGEAWAPVGARILASLSSRFGTGPQSLLMPALLGVGRK